MRRPCFAMNETSTRLPNGNVLVHVPMNLVRVSHRRRVIVPEKPLGESADTIVARIGRARQWAAALEAGEAAGPKALADELGMDRSNLAKELVLATISPRVVRRILAGDLPNDLSLAKLRALRTTVWSEQERALGLA